MTSSKDLWTFFQHEVFTLRSTHGGTPRLNPYREEVPGIDKPGAARIRQHNLQNYIESIDKMPHTLLIGEAPGWRGCRFSGVPFTSEKQLSRCELAFAGSKSSQRDQPFSEASATIFWRVLRDHHQKFLVWNCLPLHPHQEGEKLSNRRPKMVEIQQFAPILTGLISLMKPKQIVAIGRTAETALNQLGYEVKYVRHPSHGGSRAFSEGAAKLFDDD